jgi:alanine racemase
MNRFGFKDINEYKKAVDSPYNIIGVYTHVSDKENLINQENKFKEYLKIKNYPYVHMGGSVAYSTRVVGNYIRIGFDLYGDSQKDNIKQAVKFYSKILTINNLEKGETVGYGREYVMKEKGRVAVLPVGYNDGLRRSLKGFLVSINNKLYPIIGRICMNHCFVLIDDDVLEEDEVIFYSSDYSVNHMADFAKTNSYEAFCMMKPNHYIYIS